MTSRYPKEAESDEGVVHPPASEMSGSESDDTTVSHPIDESLRGDDSNVAPLSHDTTADAEASQTRLSVPAVDIETLDPNAHDLPQFVRRHHMTITFPQKVRGAFVCISDQTTFRLPFFSFFLEVCSWLVFSRSFVIPSMDAWTPWTMCNNNS
jgi:hypothetical protein